MLSRFVYMKEKLHIAAFVSDAHIDRYCFKSAMQAAMKLINEDKSILPNHQLIIHFIDNFVSSILAGRSDCIAHSFPVPVYVDSKSKL